MRIMVGISHPKHVYMFKNLIHKMEKNGHEFEVIVTEKEITSYLLEQFKIPFEVIGKNQPTIIRKILDLPLLFYRTLKIAKRFKPDIFIGQASPQLAYASALQNKPYIVFEDTEIVKHLHKIVMPFTDVIVTPTCFKRDMGKKQVRFNGYFELAYLHPNYFKPNPSVLDEVCVSMNDKFIVMRFVSWQAHHDVGEHGLTLKMKMRAVNDFQKYGKVFISSEGQLPKELEKYHIRLGGNKMHSLLHYATLFFGDSPTMTTESGVLGTPAVCISSWAISAGNFVDLSNNYNIINSFLDGFRAIDFSLDLLKNDSIKQEWKDKKKKLLRDKIDVTAFMTWFIENYPESHEIMKENSEYQERFK